MKQRPKQRKKHMKYLWIFLLLAMTLISYSGYRLYRYYTAYVNYAKEQALLQQQSAPPVAESKMPDVSTSADINTQVLPQYSGIYAENPDLVGWIQVPDTEINYPVMQTPEEPEFYLTHDFKKNPHVNGTPFLDFRCNIAPLSQNTIIYGHNMKSGAMFHDLLLFSDPNFFASHPEIYFDTLYATHTYEVVAAFYFDVLQMTADSFQFHQYVDFPDAEARQSYAAELNERSLYDKSVTFGEEDQILTLVTCEYSTDDSRFVVIAKKRP